MMSNTSKTLTAELQQRLALTSEQAEGSTPDTLILVVYRMYGNDVHLRVYAPGLDERALRDALREGLEKALVGRHEDWVVDVLIEDGEVVVVVAEYGHLRDKTLPVVLGAIPAQLQPLEMVRWRRVHVLSEYQKLVLVSVEELEGAFGLSFEFPGELTIEGVEDDPRGLERDLHDVLREQTDRPVTVSYYAQRSGTHRLTVTFYPAGGRPPVPDYYRAVATVKSMVAKRSTASGAYSSLVFAEAREFEPWVDDGSEPDEPYEEY